VRRRVSRDKEDSIQGEGVRHRFGHFEMAAVNRIERAAVNSDASPQTFLVHEPDPIKKFMLLTADRLSDFRSRLFINLFTF
jgi:hypothetical protein